MNYDQLTTEERNEKTMNLDLMPISEILHIMNREDLEVVKSIEKILPTVEKVIEKVVKNFMNGGRLFMLGQGRVVDWECLMRLNVHQLLCLIQSLCKW